jgi:integrase
MRLRTYDWLRRDELGPCSTDFEPIARFAIFTGLRRREVVFLQRGDVDLANGVIQVRVKPHLGFTPKNGKERSVPIDPVLRPILEQHLRDEVKPAPNAFVFPQRGGARRSERTLWFAEATAATSARAGIGRELTFHDLRRTYGAMCIEAGMDLLTVSKLLGHSDIKITQEVYAPICGRYLAQETSALGRHLEKHLLRSALEPSVGSLESGCNTHAPSTQDRGSERKTSVTKWS